MDRMKFMFVIVVLLLIAAVGYIGVGMYSDIKLQEQTEIYQIGTQYGYETAIGQMFQQAGSCQQVPLTYNNQTINIIAIECLQQAAVA